jgi:cob(I)alamin adenosyltransferase
MRIYTRTGDDGTTGLIGGARVGKDDLRIECYGTIDELNACLGLCAVCSDESIKSWLVPVMNELFVIGARLATPAEARDLGISAAMVERLEQQIDAAQKRLPELHQFILPGGTELSARLHLARTVCRRAERLLVHFSRTNPLEEILLQYINRLSDWLFVVARLANQIAGVGDVAWKK